MAVARAPSWGSGVGAPPPFPCAIADVEEARGLPAHREEQRVLPGGWRNREAARKYLTVWEQGGGGWRKYLGGGGTGRRRVEEQGAENEGAGNEAEAARKYLTVWERGRERGSRE